MIVSERVRAARKDAQIKRLAAKEAAIAAEDPESYSAYYAAQPLQQVRREENERIAAATIAVNQATEAVQLAEVDGVGLQEARVALAQAKVQLIQAQAVKDAAKGGKSTLTEVKA